MSNIRGILTLKKKTIKDVTPVNPPTPPPTESDHESDQDSDDDSTKIKFQDNGDPIFYKALRDKQRPTGEFVQGVPSYIHNNPDCCLIARQYSFIPKDSKERIEGYHYAPFYSSNNYRDAVKFVLTGKLERNNPRSYYAVIQEDDPVRLYFDFDCKDDKFDNEEETENEYQTKAVSAILSAIQTTTGTELSDDDLLIYHSSRPGKISFHVETRNHYVKNNQQIKPIALLANNLLKMKDPNGIDQLVYTVNRNWRLAGSRKADTSKDDNTKRLYDEDLDLDKILPQQIKGCTLIELLDDYKLGKSIKSETITDIPDEVVTALESVIPGCSLEGSRVKYNGATCPMCNEVHVRDNGKITHFEGSYFFRCFHAKQTDKSVFLWKSDNRIWIENKDDEVEAGELVYELLKDSVRMADKQYYHKDNNRWNYVTSTELTNHLIKVCGLLEIVTKVVKKGKKDEPDTEEEIRLYRSYRSLTNLSKLIITLIPNDDKFLDQIVTSNSGYLCFMDKVYSFRDKKFHEWTSKIGKTVQTFTVIPRNAPVKRNLKNIEIVNNRALLPIFNTTETRDRFLTAISRALSGLHIHSKEWHIGQGERNCGKSLLVDITNACFGGYVSQTDGNNLVEKRVDSSADCAKQNSFMLDFRFSRLLFTSEIKATRPLDGEMLKRLMSGGDVQVARKNNVNEVYFKLQTTLFMMVNTYSPPTVRDAMDTCKHWPFHSKFVEKLKGTEPSGYKLSDPKIKDDMVKSEMLDALFWLIVEAYKTDDEIKQLVQEDDEEEVIDELSQFKERFDDYFEKGDKSDHLRSTEILDIIHNNIEAHLPVSSRMTPQKMNSRMPILDSDFKRVKCRKTKCECFNTWGFTGIKLKKLDNHVVQTTSFQIA